MNWIFNIKHSDFEYNDYDENVAKHKLNYHHKHIHAQEGYLNFI